jgi:hypothetical protein
MTFAFGYAVINSSAKHAAGTSHTAFKAHGIRDSFSNILFGGWMLILGSARAADPSPPGRTVLPRRQT